MRVDASITAVGDSGIQLDPGRWAPLSGTRCAITGSEKQHDGDAPAVRTVALHGKQQRVTRLARAGRACLGRGSYGVEGQLSLLTEGRQVEVDGLALHQPVAERSHVR